MGTRPAGYEQGMDLKPGPLETEKHSSVDNDGDVQPTTDEVESARLLANEASERLPGIDDEHLRRLADEFIARDRSEALEDFVAWARERAATHGAEPPAP